MRSKNLGSAALVAIAILVGFAGPAAAEGVGKIVAVVEQYLIGKGVLDSSGTYSVSASSFSAQSANVGLLGPTSGGSATPSFRALVAADLGTTLSPTFASVTATDLQVGATATLQWASGVLVYRPAVGVVGVANGITASKFRVFNTTDYVGNDEYVEAAWSANVCTLQAGKTGSGTVRSLNFSGGSGTFSTGLTLTGATITGTPTWSSSQAITLSTAAQPNVTSLGTLTGLTMGGTLTLGANTLALASATVSGTPTWSSSQAITLSTAAQTNVTSLGTLTGLTMGGTLTVGQNTLSLASSTVSGTPTWSSNQAITLSTAAQPNVTSLGTLTSLATGTITMTDATNIVINATTGTKIGTATSQKIGFFNATPVVQITGSADVLAGLVTLGLRAASSNPPLDLGSGAITAGNITGTLQTAAQANVTSLGTLTGLTVTNNAANNTSTLILTKNPGGAQSGNALQILGGTTLTGDVVRIATGAAAPAAEVGGFAIYDDNTCSQISASQASTTRAPQVVTRRSRGTHASPSVASSGDLCMKWIGQSYASSGGFGNNALVTMAADGTQTSNVNCPGRIEFWTVPSGSGTEVSRWAIKSAGHLQGTAALLCGWVSSTTDPTGTVDLNVNRDSAGVLSIGTTAANALGSLKCTGVTLTGTLTLATGSVKFAAGSTGATTNLLGANGPNATTTPNTWVAVTLSDGTTGYMPIWK